MASESKVSAEDLAAAMGNPFYTIQIAPGWVRSHRPLVNEDRWVAANVVLIDEIGVEAWLRQLLDVLTSEPDWDAFPGEVAEPTS